MKTIDKNSRLPLYYQLMDLLIEQIENGELKQGDKLLSERELCEQYDISRSTVRLAIQELEREGYIYKQHGIGTFVSNEKFKQDLLRFYSFTEEMKKIGKVPLSKVIDFEIIHCDNRIARKMNTNMGEKMYKFRRLRLANNEPMMIETSYVPFDRFPGITGDDLENQAMYDIFIHKFNASFTMAEETFKPVVTNEEEAAYLQIDTSVPSLMIERTTYEEDHIIEYTVGIARGDRFKYRVILKK
ncbi:GntR family transcriptional regulator [Alkaliphilus peptidifermentans]|uniref:GntR family transcriptional regulator n=1 Tax=Alkaliphilus peptidifermentans DSM 18978 TaxID=1120976 RepID=A0A1G5FY81_9FIRM|nr:GntR family transcriptional regulator [Alkaliphilus peptidifermentans]SCY44164.1 GntR family transcriptional regulator [Alkaliphilus peptidifermentans DSM 18978]